MLTIAKSYFEPHQFNELFFSATSEYSDSVIYATLHKKWSFPLRISSENVTADLVTFTEEILNRKLYLLCSERLVVTIWERKIIKIIFCIGSFKYISTLHERIFSTVKRSFSFFRSKKTQIFSFLIMTGWERSKIRVFEQKTFNYIFCIGNFRQVPAIKKYF